MNNTYADFTDDVNGQVIGAILMRGKIFYDGRSQGQDIYTETEVELRTMANDAYKAIKTQAGRAFELIYPNVKAWELRIYA